MVQKDLDLIHALFGSDLDSGVIVSRSDDKLGSKCQRGIIKEAGKCQSAKLRSYNECKKGGMKDRDEPITSPAEFETLCMTPTILDVKGRIDKACTKGLPKRLTSSCSLPNVDDLIPGCAPGVSAACIDQKIECVVCLALNALDGLFRDCDEFDDGVVNGSCPQRLGDEMPHFHLGPGPDESDPPEGLAW